jgi:hypothetical protein
VHHAQHHDEVQGEETTALALETTNLGGAVSLYRADKVFHPDLDF